MGIYAKKLLDSNPTWKLTVVVSHLSPPVCFWAYVPHTEEHGGFGPSHLSRNVYPGCHPWLPGARSSSFGLWWLNIICPTTTGRDGQLKDFEKFTLKLLHLSSFLPLLSHLEQSPFLHKTGISTCSKLTSRKVRNSGVCIKFTLLSIYFQSHVPIITQLNSWPNAKQLVSALLMWYTTLIHIVLDSPKAATHSES